LRFHPDPYFQDKFHRIFRVIKNYLTELSEFRDERWDEEDGMDGRILILPLLIRV
jgi:hypothetical protein